MAYASYTDYEARYGTLTPAQQSLVTMRLADAAVILDSLVDTSGVCSDEHLQDRLKVVSCSMVNRVLLSEAEGSVGVSNTSYTMGPFSQSATYANPSGDMYLTATERRMLGISKAIIGTIRPVIGPTP